MLRDRENGADFVLRYYIYIKHNFCVLFLIKSAPSRLSPIEAITQTTKKADVTNPTTQKQPESNTETTTNPQNTTAVVSTPKATKISKTIAKKKSITLKWKAVKNVKGYEIQVATDKKFKKNKKTISVNKQKATIYIVKKLKAKKTYYVRVRSYFENNGKKIYSPYSAKKKVTIK